MWHLCPWVTSELWKNYFDPRKVGKRRGRKCLPLHTCVCNGSAFQSQMDRGEISSEISWYLFQGLRSELLQTVSCVSFVLPSPGSCHQCLELGGNGQLHTHTHTNTCRHIPRDSDGKHLWDPTSLTAGEVPAHTVGNPVLLKIRLYLQNFFFFFFLIEQILANLTGFGIEEP